MRRRVIAGAVGIWSALVLQQAGAGADGVGARHFDLLIQGAEVIDGSGAPRYRADVAINGDEIVAIGPLADVTATRVIDARGRIVTPGFIDLHAHVADGESGESGMLSPDRRRRAAQNFVMQGITTTVTNPDGSQPMSLPEQRGMLEAKGIGPNVILLNGHGDMRARAMRGDTRRPANSAEIRAMQEELRRGLAQEGSFGLSLGTEYTPGRYASTEEQVELARVLPAYNGIFIPHLRSQGIAPMWYLPSAAGGVAPPTLDDAVDEVLQVADTTGALVVFTHMKAWGPGYRGEGPRLIRKLQAARERGDRVYMDVYPYSSSASDGNFVALPPWALESRSPGKNQRPDYKKALRATLAAADAKRREDLERDVLHQLALKGGPENVRILAFPKASYVGKSYAELMKLRGMSAVELAIALQMEGDPRHRGGASMRSFSMDERDIDAFYKLDWCAVSTDGWIVLPEEAVGDKKYVDTNQRNFGTYPRRLAYFSHERGVDTLEHAVRAASGLPAKILGLTDRGRLAVGMKADLVVLDLATLRDTTTDLEPSRYPEGVEYVLVNGQAVVDANKPTLALPGKVLWPAGRAASANAR